MGLFDDPPPAKRKILASASASRIVYRACHAHDEWVELTDPEYDEAVAHGRWLRRHSVNRGLTDRCVADDKERTQVLGAITERAVSKALGIPWTRWVDTFKDPDLHHGVEVRLIGVDHYGLRVYPNDHPERRVVGVVMEKGKERQPYRLPGWCYARYGQQARWLMDPRGRGRPVHSVPQENLDGLSLLRAIIYAEQQRGQS